MLIRSIRNWLNQPTGEFRKDRRGVWGYRIRWELLLVFWWVPYLLMILFTFGYNASRHPTFEDYRATQIVVTVNSGDDAFTPPRKEEKTYPRDNVATAVKSSIAGLFWPFYWAWELMDEGDVSCTRITTDD